MWIDKAQLQTFTELLSPECRGKVCCVIWSEASIHHMVFVTSLIVGTFKGAQKLLHIEGGIYSDFAFFIVIDGGVSIWFTSVTQL